MPKQRKNRQAQMTLDARQLSGRYEHMRQLGAGLCAAAAAACLPYMPKVTGALIDSVRCDAEKGEIHVGAHYARRVYYRNGSVGRPSGPLRGPQWFARMKADKAGALLQQLAHDMGVK